MTRTYTPAEKAASKINNAILTAKRVDEANGGEHSLFHLNLPHLVIHAVLEAAQYRSPTYQDKLDIEEALKAITGNESTIQYLNLAFGHFERHGTLVDVAMADMSALLYQLYLEAEFQFKAESMTATKTVQVLFNQVYLLAKALDQADFLTFYKQKRAGYLRDVTN